MRTLPELRFSWGRAWRRAQLVFQLKETAKTHEAVCSVWQFCCVLLRVELVSIPA